MPVEKRTSPEKSKKSGAVVAWFEERMKSATMKVEAVPLSELRGWGMVRSEGDVVEKFANLDQKGTPRFFTFEGRRISASGREVDSFDQPGVIEVPNKADLQKTSGTVGLLVDINSGDVLVQVAAEPLQAEPGSEPSAYLVLRASVQGSYDNITLHKVPFSDRIDQTAYTNFVPVNPSRISGNVRVGVTHVQKGEIDLTDKPNFKWFSRKEIDKGIQDGAPFNSFFHSAYSILKAQRAPRRVAH